MVTNRHSHKAGYNRLISFKTHESKVMRELTIEGAHCLGAKCQMWNGSDCGLKATPAGIMDLVGEVGETYTAYNDAQDTVEGDAAGV